MKMVRSVIEIIYRIYDKILKVCIYVVKGRNVYTFGLYGRLALVILNL